MCHCLACPRLPTPSSFSLRQRLYRCRTGADVVEVLRSMHRKSADSFVDLLAMEFDACPPTPEEVSQVVVWVEDDEDFLGEEQYAVVTLAVSMGEVMRREGCGGKRGKA